MSSEIAIEVRDVGKAYLIYRRPEDRLKQMLLRWRKYYDEYWALRSVNMTVKRGEAIGIVGRNGSGKSTLLQIICGTLQPSTGTVVTQGRIAGLLELGAGFNPEFTGSENVQLVASLLGLTSEQIRDRFSAIAEFAGIGDFMNQPVKTYSSGMFARLAFAVAAHVDADILVVDEIPSVGDAAFTQRCMRFIRKFRENGTLLIVSHDIGAISNLCDRAIWIDSGSVRSEGDPKDVCLAYMAAQQGEIDDGASFKIGKGGVRSAAATQPSEARPAASAPIAPDAKVQVFDFNPDAPWFGARGAIVESVRLTSGPDNDVPALGGGEEVTLTVECLALQDVDQPIIGFYVRDRLGQTLFGDNTYLSHQFHQMHVSAGRRFVGSFRFVLPYLPTGDYAITVAIAEGTQEHHTQHHWLDEALIFRVLTSHVARGLMGIPMASISLEVMSHSEFT